MIRLTSAQRGMVVFLTSDVSVQVLSILSRVLAIEMSKLSPTMKRSECKVWDSLRHMELIVTVEDQFGLQLTYEEISQMQSLNDIIRVLTGRIQ